ncbi:aminotransferase class I/II-fold pyridoxal phosphate-dependent enzyme, partial [Pauljensenia sp. UMB3104]
RSDLKGLSPYGAPQLNVPVCLNVNENPYSPSENVIADIAESVAKAAAGLNRYPDRDFMELRCALADYLEKESGVRRRPELMWAANG